MTTSHPIVPFRPPSDREMRQMIKALDYWRAVTRPYFQGDENIPSTRPLLFVGNHTLFGMLDAPLLFAHLYQEKNIFLRSLGDHVHFRVPLWRDWLTKVGAVDGTRENCATLMQAGECILVFPGGAREVSKRKGESYRLVWGNRMGFARMAIEHGCTIVPFAAVGVEDAFDIVKDADDFFKTPFGQLARALGLRDDMVPPLVRLSLRGGMPKPERFYFGFGTPIAPHAHGAEEQLRDRTKAAVESLIADLQRVQNSDPERHVLSLGRQSSHNGQKL